MRSLEHWTKYLEQQETQLHKALDERAKTGIEDQLPLETPEAEPPVLSRLMSSTAVREAVSMRKRFPEQLKTMGGKWKEVAQNSYRGFKETREELLQRLLDPPLTLEETARVLNVCPATVRRYTNRGLLKHFRTAGNQRRFRLSDVLTFMESSSKSAED